MRYIKHFIKVAGWMIKRNFCKHADIRSASCPFTGMTYTTCEECGKRMEVRRTNNEY
jgi:hypothetical protein